MFGKRQLHLLVDGLTETKGSEIRRNLSVVPGIVESRVDVGRATVSVVSLGDVESSVRLACEAAGVAVRTKLRGR